MKLNRAFVSRFFVLGLIVVLLLECGGLLFLEKYYLVDKDNYHATVVSLAQMTKHSTSIQLGNVSGAMQFSYDGGYVSYVGSNTIHIVDMDNGTSTNVSATKGRTIVNYTWIYDRNRLIIAEKSNDDDNFKLYSYDVDDKTKAEVYNVVNNASIEIAARSSNETVNQIVVSTLTNLIYLKLTDGDNSRIYKINIMAQKNNVSVYTHHIGKLVLLRQNAVLFYENTYNGRVYETSYGDPVIIEDNRSFKLVGVDNQDNVALALTESSGKTKAIYYGDVDNYKLSRYTLQTAVSPADIFLGSDGSLFYTDTAKHRLVNLKSRKVYPYNGSMVGIFEGGCLTNNNGRITRMMF